MRNTLMLTILVVQCLNIQAQKVSVSAKALNDWNFSGIGSKIVDNHDIFLMKEAVEGSKGIMIISPESYGDDNIMTYEIMTLTPATVCVAILALSNKGEVETLTIDKDFDGANGKWGADTSQCYFFAFRNVAHNYYPFLRKRTDPPVVKGFNLAYQHHKNVMQNGIFHEIEVGQKGGKIWLKIDGKKIIKHKDNNPYQGGHLAIRIRGTAGEYAACFIRNLAIIPN